MNKLIATLVLFLSALNLLQAQDGYIKYHTDSEYRNKTVKVFKGEIVPFYKIIKQKEINVIIGNDTIKDLAITSKSYDVITPTKLNYLTMKDDLIQLKQGVGVIVNINSIEKTDSAFVYSESKTQLTKLVGIREVTIKKEDCGNTIRLVISNAPTIYYSIESLKEFVESTPPETSTTTETKTTEETKSALAWWVWVLIGLSIVGIALVIWKYFFKSKSNSNVAEFYSGSLKDFANQNGGIKKLSELNPKLIPPYYEKLDKNDRQRITEKLYGKKIIICADNETSFGFQEPVIQNKSETISSNENEMPKETFVQQTNIGNNNGLSNQLRQMENKIVHEIQRMSSGNNNTNEINRLKNEKIELENKLRGLETDKKNVDAKVLQIQTDKTILETNLQNANDEKSRVQNEIKELKERVIAVEFLKGYSESVFTYLKYCQQVSSDAFNFFNKISQQNPKQAFAAGHLLMKFQSAINSIPVGDWLRTVQDIKDSGATTNRQLTRSFSQIQNDSDKQKEFQRLLFSEVLTKYSSNILILAEAFKNLSRFQGSADFASEAQSTFGKHVTEIVNKAKSTGLDIKHVPLFESWEKYLGQVEDNGGERSLAYKEINGLEKGAIAEIVSYGVKTSFGDDTKTIIILA